MNSAVLITRPQLCCNGGYPYLVDKAENVWVIVGQLLIKAGWWDVPLALRDFSRSNKHNTSGPPLIIIFCFFIAIFPPRNMFGIIWELFVIFLILLPSFSFPFPCSRHHDFPLLYQIRLYNFATARVYKCCSIFCLNSQFYGLVKLQFEGFLHRKTGIFVFLGKCYKCCSGKFVKYALCWLRYVRIWY